MAIHVTRWFACWANQQGLSHEALCRSVHEMSKGLYEADLGGHLFKKRIARPGAAKPGGFRDLIATSFGDRWIFVYGFSKNDQDNIEPSDLRGLRIWAAKLMDMSFHELIDAHEKGEITRIDYDA